MDYLIDYYTVLLGADQGKQLADYYYPTIYGITGSVFCIFQGNLVDKVGLENALAINAGFLIIITILQVLPIFFAQVMWIICWTSEWSIFFIISARFAMHYAPMELFGTYQGLLSGKLLSSSSSHTRTYHTNLFFIFHYHYHLLF